MLLFATVAFGMPFVLTLYAQQVLGYSALEFGPAPRCVAVGAAVGSIVGQAAVLKLGLRRVAATGMTLMGAGRCCSRRCPSVAATSGTSFSGSRLRPRLSASPSSRRRSRPSRALPNGVRARVWSQQHRPPGRPGARRRRRLDGRRLPLGGLPGGARRCESTRRAQRGVPVRLRGLRRAGRHRRGAGAHAPRRAEACTA